MGFSNGELVWINSFVRDGYDLSNILMENFGDKTISIIRKYVEGSKHIIVKDVFLDEDKAMEEMSLLNSNIQAKYNRPVYYVISGSIKNLLNEKIFDEKMGVPIDEVDGMIVYNKLEEKLKLVL